MANSINLKSDPIPKLFKSYLVPSIIAMAAISIQIIVDGIFVGKGIGSEGIAAVNIVVPLFTVFTGIGLLFGVGGATISSFALAGKDKQKANSTFSLVLDINWHIFWVRLTS
jgi:Na+-driven multidrug efflux pump